MSILRKIDNKRASINANATKRAGINAQNVAAQGIGLIGNVALAVATKNPYAVAGAITSAALLANELFW